MTHIDPTLLTQFPFPAVIDNTMREDWLNCPHSFFRRHVQGLRLVKLGEPGTEPTEPRSINLHFGGALAQGLEGTRLTWHLTGNEDEALAQGAADLMRAWGDEPLPAPTTRTEEAKTLDACLLAHAGYFREWPLDDPMQTVAVVDGRPLVEFSGACPIPGCFHPTTGEPILYAGRFDAVLSRFGVLWGLDDKTTGSAVESDNWRSQWRLRGQFTGYCWLADAWGYHIRNFLVHGVQVLKTRCNYSEAVLDRPDWKINVWVKQLQDDVRNMVLQYENFLKYAHDISYSHPFPQALGHACHSFNTPCSYLSNLCDQPRPDDFLDNYIVRRWDPLRVKGEVEA